MKSPELGLFPFSPDMRNAQIGNPNVIFVNLLSAEQYFIDEVVIPEDVGQRVKHLDLSDLVLYWRTSFNTDRKIQLTPHSINPDIFEYPVVMEKRVLYIRFIVDELEFAPKSHRRCIALFIYENKYNDENN